MRIGTLRHAVAIKRLDATLVLDSFGQPTDEWSTIAVVSASVKPVAGRELTLARQRQSSMTHEITIRYYPGLTPADRIEFGSRVFNIESITDPDERNRTLTISAIEQTTGGV